MFAGSHAASIAAAASVTVIIEIQYFNLSFEHRCFAGAIPRLDRNPRAAGKNK